MIKDNIDMLNYIFLMKEYSNFVEYISLICFSFDAIRYLLL